MSDKGEPEELDSEEEDAKKKRIAIEKNKIKNYEAMVRQIKKEQRIDDNYVAEDYLSVNEGSEILGEKELAYYVQKFDMYKIKSFVKEVVGQELLPVMKIQQDQIYQIEENRKTWLQLDYKASKAADDLNRAQKTLSIYKELSVQIKEIAAKVSNQDRKLEREMDPIKDSQLIIKKELLEMEKKVSSTLDALKAMQKRDETVNSALQSVNRIRDETWAHVEKELSKLRGRMDDQMGQMYGFGESITALRSKSSSLMSVVQKYDASIGKLQAAVNQITVEQEEQNNDLEELKRLRANVGFLEDEMRQIRMLTEQSIGDTKASLKTAITQRDCEHTIIKFNFDMMRSVLCNLENTEQAVAVGMPTARNMYLADQLRVDFCKYQEVLMKKHEKVHEKGTDMSSTFTHKVQSSKELRKDWFRLRIDVQPIFKKPKYDKYGDLRSTSVMDWMPKKSLQASGFKVALPADPAEEMNNPGGLKGILKKKKLKEKRVATRDFVEKPRPWSAPLKITSSENQQPAGGGGFEQPLFTPIVSQELQMVPPQPPQVVALPASGDPEPPQEINDEKPGAQPQPQQMSKPQPMTPAPARTSSQPPPARAQQQQSYARPQQQSYTISQQQQYGAQLQRPIAQMVQAQGQYQQPQAPRTGFSLPAGISRLGPGNPARLGKKNKPKPARVLAPEDLVKWGSKQLIKYPHAPDGMQFVNEKGLANLEDFDQFKSKQQVALEYLLQESMREFGEAMYLEMDRRDSQQQKLVADTQSKLELDIQNVIDYDLAKLDRLTQQRQADLQSELEAKLTDSANHFEECFAVQNAWNDETRQKVKHNTRKMNNHYNDLQLADKRSRDQIQALEETLGSTQGEFLNVLDTINSLLELNYLTSLLEFQDEVDRHFMSLWALQPAETATGKIKQQLVQTPLAANTQSTGTRESPSLLLDEDCLSCSLEKYRPFINEAFKMACVQYKPGPIAFRGKDYSRKSLINLKRAMLMELSQNKLQDNLTWQKHLDDTGAGVGPDTFLATLQQKIQENGQALNLTPGARSLDMSIEELQINRELKAQVIQNPSMLGMLYEKTNDGLLIKNFLSQATETSFGANMAKPGPDATTEMLESDERTDQMVSELESSRQRTGNDARNIHNETQNSFNQTHGSMHFNKTMNSNFKRKLRIDENSDDNDTSQASGPKLGGGPSFVSGKYTPQMASPNTRSPHLPQIASRVETSATRNRGAVNQSQDLVRFAKYGIRGADRLSQPSPLTGTKRESLELENPFRQTQSRIVSPHSPGSKSYIGSSQKKNSNASVSSVVMDQLKNNNILVNPLSTKSDARNVKDALDMMNYSQKQDLLQQLKERKKQNKKIDNIATITGVSTEDLRRNHSHYEKEIGDAQISSLTAHQARGQGPGYMYSKGLVNDLKGPLNKKTNLNTSKIYTNKNKEIDQISGLQTLKEIFQSRQNAQSALESQGNKRPTILVDQSSISYLPSNGPISSHQQSLPLLNKGGSSGLQSRPLQSTRHGSNNRYEAYLDSQILPVKEPIQGIGKPRKSISQKKMIIAKPGKMPKLQPEDLQNFITVKGSNTRTPIEKPRLEMNSRNPERMQNADIYTTTSPAHSFNQTFVSLNSQLDSIHNAAASESLAESQVVIPEENPTEIAPSGEVSQQQSNQNLAK